jgi:hypothetical protein
VHAALGAEGDVWLKAYWFFEATVRKLKRRANVFEFPLSAASNGRFVKCRVGVAWHPVFTCGAYG